MYARNNLIARLRSHRSYTVTTKLRYKIIIMKCKMNKIYNNNKQWVNEKDVGQFIHPEGCHPRMLQE